MKTNIKKLLIICFISIMFVGCSSNESINDKTTDNNDASKEVALNSVVDNEKEPTIDDIAYDSEMVQNVLDTGAFAYYSGVVFTNNSEKILKNVTFNIEYISENQVVHQTDNHVLELNLEPGRSTDEIEVEATPAIPYGRFEIKITSCEFE